MKLLKSTLLVVALFAMGSVSPKGLTTRPRQQQVTTSTFSASQKSTLPQPEELTPVYLTQDEMNKKQESIAPKAQQIQLETKQSRSSTNPFEQQAASTNPFKQQAASTNPFKQQAVNINPFTGQRMVPNPFAAQQPSSPQVGVNPFTVPEKKIELAEKQSGGAFSTLFDYESYLTRLMPANVSGGAAALAGSVGTAAAIFLGPTIVGYVTLMGAAKLAGTALLFDRVGFAWRNGAISSTSAIKMIKDGLEQRIGDSGLYPTYAMQKESLLGNREFLNSSQVDETIFNQARNQLIDDVNKNLQALKFNTNENNNQNNINEEINVLRSRYFKNNDLKGYVKSLETNNDLTRSRALVSEYLRSKNMVAIAEQAAQQAKEEAGMPKQPSAKADLTEQVKSNTFVKAVRDWWYGKQTTEPSTATGVNASSGNSAGTEVKQ